MLLSVKKKIAVILDSRFCIHDTRRVPSILYRESTCLLLIRGLSKTYIKCTQIGLFYVPLLVICIIPA
jgi:hypothetical protein